MVKREFDATFINLVANDPAVKPGAKIDGFADLTEVVSDYRNVLLTYEYGGFLLLYKSPGAYEIHTLALKAGRGQMLREAAREMLGYMFFQTDCERLITTAYKDNPSAAALSREFMTEKGETEKYHYFELTYRDWVVTCDIAREAGEQFHEIVDTNHADDVFHDHHAGGACILIRYGNILKAVKQYNEWAVMSGYQTFRIVQPMPLILSSGDMQLIYHNFQLEQIKCL